MNRLSSTSLGLFLAISLIVSIQPWSVEASNCSITSFGFTPLNDRGPGIYNGQQGGLYSGGNNMRPLAHENAGLQLAHSIRPLDTNGQPSANGKIVLLSIGMSNTTQEFSVFKPMADVDVSKNPSLVIVDGAKGDLTVIAQILKDRFPNIRLACYSSRIYAGYADTTLNPEPYAYQAGFAVKWMIEQQINGAPELNYDPTHGTVRAPWLSWGPYLWADGMNPRSDGLTYACSDFQSDGTHPAPNGAREKVAQLLLNFFKTDIVSRLWFRRRVNSTADYDGDGKSALAVIRSNVWYILQSSNGATRIERFGMPNSDIPIVR